MNPSRRRVFSLLALTPLLLAPGGEVGPQMEVTPQEPKKVPLVWEIDVDSPWGLYTRCYDAEGVLIGRLVRVDLKTMIAQQACFVGGEVLHREVSVGHCEVHVNDTQYEMARDTFPPHVIVKLIDDSPVQQKKVPMPELLDKPLDPLGC